jgi:hypothetical protein
MNLTRTTLSKSIREILRFGSSHFNYWSSSPLAKWITKTFASEDLIKREGTLERWQAWEDLYKTNYPKTYYVTEVVLDFLQDFFTYPAYVSRRFYYFLSNAFIDKTHRVSTGVGFGQWAEFDTQILNAAFNLFTLFVEKTVGVKGLEWAASLVYEEDEVKYYPDSTTIKVGEPTPQAIAAKKMLELYNWWKVERPGRVDPWETFMTQFPRDGLNLVRSEEEKAASRAALEKDAEYYQEDTQKLVELISMRDQIWD